MAVLWLTFPAALQDLTASQLQSLHIAGRQGLRVPLLRDFLRWACVAYEWFVRMGTMPFSKALLTWPGALLLSMAVHVTRPIAIGT